MNVTLAPAALRAGLDQLHVKGVGRVMPILEHVVITADADGLHLRRTDLEQDITAHLRTAEIAEPGSATAPAELLKKYVGMLPDQPLVLTSDGAKVKLRCGTFRAEFASLDPDDLPTIRFDGQGVITVDGEALRTALGRVIHAAAADTMRPVLHGVHLACGAGTLYLDTADGFRVATTELATSNDAPVELIVPLMSAVQLASLLPAGTVELTIGRVGTGTDPQANALTMQSEDVTYRTTLLDGTFPDIRSALIDRIAAFPNRVEIDRQALITAVRAVSAAAGSAAVPVLIDVHDGQLHLSCEADGGSGSAVLEIVHDNAFRFGMASRYLLDLLRTLDDDTFTLSHERDDAPVGFTGQAMIGVIMPMHVNWAVVNQPVEAVPA